MAETMVKRFVVGYALAPKKQASFIQQSLINLAREKGIDLIRIDTEKPLVDQGEFDCLLHKLYGDDWKKQLKEYSIKNPSCLVIDSPESIQRLHNRVSMLEAVNELKIECKTASFGVPKQAVLFEAISALEVNVDSAALKFPVIAKPLVADGSAKSHKMLLVFNNEGLNKLKPPIVLQEFVNHGGVIFKVYVVGDCVKCVKRKSLPDVDEESLGNLEGCLSFSQVSNLNAFENNFEGYYKLMHLEDIEYPPLALVTDIARGLREATKLHLFNFDVIRDTSVGNRYLVIDINYFPGYAKMPNYEIILTDFFWDVLSKRDQCNDKVEKKMMVNNCEDEIEKRLLLVENTEILDEDENGDSVSVLEREEQVNSF